MSVDTRVAAFVEYVLRPLSDDWRQILSELRSLNIGLTQKTVKHIMLALGLWHLVGEIVRALSYIVITWIICRTVVSLLPRLG